MKIKKLVGSVSLMFALLLVVGVFLTGCGGSSSSRGGGGNPPSTTATLTFVNDCNDGHDICVYVDYLYLGRMSYGQSLSKVLQKGTHYWSAATCDWAGDWKWWGGKYNTPAVITIDSDHTERLTCG